MDKVDDGSYTAEELIMIWKWEARLMNDLKEEEHVVWYYDYFIDTEKLICYVAMEKIRGPTLEKLAIKLKMLHESGQAKDFKEIMFEILRQGAEGLLSLFHKDVEHWDIKGDNIFIDISNDPTLVKLYESKSESFYSKFNSSSKFTLKLGDFGVSKSVASL